MKLIYVYLGGGKNETSVQNKIICQINELNNNSVQTVGYFFTPDVDETYKLAPNVSLIPLQPYLGNKKFFNNFFEAKHFYNQMNDWLKKESDNFDFIFLRHVNANKSYFKLLNNFSNRIYLYIPSNSIMENYREVQYAKKASIVSTLFRWIEFYFCFYFNELNLWKNYLSKLKGVVVFTEEFGNILRKKSKGKINIIYNRDGVNCSEIPIRKFNGYSNPKIKLLFMKGSSSNQPWSGLTRLIESIKQDNKHRFELYVTGNIVNTEDYQEDFIKLTGRLSNEELINLVNDMDLGVSNLANYLIDFNETTNLKSRDYFARGLPFIQANTMPDIEGTTAQNFYLLLPNDNTIIDMNAVADFALKMRQDKEVSQRMRDFAQQKLDWSVTVKELSQNLYIL